MINFLVKFPIQIPENQSICRIFQNRMLISVIYALLANSRDSSILIDSVLEAFLIMKSKFRIH
jgi:hypothetical protein